VPGSKRVYITNIFNLFTAIDFFQHIKKISPQHHLKLSITVAGGAEESSLLKGVDKVNMKTLQLTEVYNYLCLF
jgi:hypothetical protein